MIPMLASMAAPLVSQALGDAAQKLLPGPMGNLLAPALSALQQHVPGGAGAGSAGAGAGLLGDLVGKIRISF
jgi:hypothetical protein